MTKSFYGSEDHGLYNRLKTELPGLLNWALDGRQRLYGRGHFVQPDSAKAAVRVLEELGSPIRAFLRQTCRECPGAEVSQADLFTPGVGGVCRPAT